MFCRNCGKEIDDGTKFCPACGASMDGITGTTQTGNATASVQTPPVQEDKTTGKKKTRAEKQREKVYKDWVYITLEKPGSEAIQVHCPKKIKQNPFSAITDIQMTGLSGAAEHVNPRDPKDVRMFRISYIVYIVLFIIGFIVNNIAEAGVLFISLLFIAAFVFQVILSKNYLFLFIKRKLKEGYSINDGTQRAICEAAGIFR